MLSKPLLTRDSEYRALFKFTILLHLGRPPGLLPRPGPSSLPVPLQTPGAGHVPSSSSLRPSSEPSLSSESLSSPSGSPYLFFTLSGFRLRVRVSVTGLRVSGLPWSLLQVLACVRVPVVFRVGVGNESSRLLPSLRGIISALPCGPAPPHHESQ
jgi:hypothetical protein